MLYRIIHGRQFDPSDLRSNLNHCKKRRKAELADISLWAGVSTYNTAGQAGLVARTNGIGTMLARLEVPENDARIALGQPSSSGHVTVWGCEQLLASCVQDVIPIP